MTTLPFGRLLRANTTEFVVGCHVSQLTIPEFGCLVRVPILPETQAYGLIYDIHIDDDGLVRQLVTAENVPAEVIADNRVNRNVPVEISVLAVGFQQHGWIAHLLPPRPPLSLDEISLCDDEELRQFTTAGHFGYFRHMLRAADLPVAELMAAHLRQANAAHVAAGNPGWVSEASKELITLLRDDYPTLMSVLGALGDALPQES